MFLSRLILKGVGVHGIEVQSKIGGKLAQFRGAVGLVPGNMEGYRRRRPDEFENRAAIFELLKNISRLAESGKPREARSACAHTPRRYSHAEILSFGDQGLNIDTLSFQLPGEMIEILFDPCFRFLVLFRDEVFINLEMCGHWCSPNVRYPLLVCRAVRQTSDQADATTPWSALAWQRFGRSRPC